MMPTLVAPDSLQLDRPISPPCQPRPLVWQDLAQQPSLEAAVLKMIGAYSFSEHPYLQWMQAPHTTRLAFCQSQLPFRFAVEAFPQSLAAVLARVPITETRMSLVENITEEHGHGNRLHSHKATFLEYLRALGATSEDLATPCSMSVLAFNHAILGYCLTQSGEAGAACLGAIEYLYIGISSTIGRTLEERQWTAPGSQSHYTNHEVLDVAHAQDLLDLAAPGWEESRSRTAVAQGLLLGAHYFWSLYDGLLPRF